MSFRILARDRESPPGSSWPTPPSSPFVLPDADTFAFFAASAAFPSSRVSFPFPLYPDRLRKTLASPLSAASARVLRV